VATSDAPMRGNVGLLIGEGSGHETLFIGFIEEGLADVAVPGKF